MERPLLTYPHMHLAFIGCSYMQRNEEIVPEYVLDPSFPRASSWNALPPSLYLKFFMSDPQQKPS